MMNDYLTREEVKELSRDIKDRTKHNKHFELPGSNHRASYYTNEAGELTLMSYYTNVCKIDKAGNFIKLWNNYSATTMKHINTFRQMAGLESLNKKEWLAL